MNNIKKKLQEVLNKKNLEETDVVYILSRIRIMFEIENKKSKYPMLNFYCNWVLHKELSHNATIKFLKEKFSINDFQMDAKKIAEKLKCGNKDFFKLNDLKKDFEGFLEYHHLTLDSKHKNYWDQFRKLLLDIIIDFPIIFNSQMLKSMTCYRQNNQTYGYKFTLLQVSRDKPIIKLKFK